MIIEAINKKLSKKEKHLSFACREVRRRKKEFGGFSREMREAQNEMLSLRSGVEKIKAEIGQLEHHRPCCGRHDRVNLENQCRVEGGFSAECDRCGDTVSVVIDGDTVSVKWAGNPTREVKAGGKANPHRLAVEKLRKGESKSSLPPLTLGQK